MSTTLTPSELRLQDIALAFSRHGGLLTAEDLLTQLRPRMSQPLSWIARRIASREILSFTSRHAIWIPRFQFADETRLELRPAVARVASEMIGIRQDWEIVSWFIERNERLGGLLPIDLLETRAERVIGAASDEAAQAPEPGAVL